MSIQHVGVSPVGRQLIGDDVALASVARDVRGPTVFPYTNPHFFPRCSVIFICNPSGKSGSYEVGVVPTVSRAVSDPLRVGSNPLGCVDSPAR